MIKRNSFDEQMAELAKVRDEVKALVGTKLTEEQQKHLNELSDHYRQRISDALEYLLDTLEDPDPPPFF